MSERLASYYDRSAQFLEPIIEWPYLLWAIVALTVSVVLLVAIRRYRRAHRPIVPFHAEGGDVEIAPQTIRGLINGTVKSVPGVKAATSRYDQRGRQLRLRISIHLQGSAKLIEVQNEIKRRVRMALHSHIGMEPKDVHPINIKVTRIVGEPDVRNAATLALPSSSSSGRRTEAHHDLPPDPTLTSEPDPDEIRPDPRAER